MARGANVPEHCEQLRRPCLRLHYARVKCLIWFASILCPVLACQPKCRLTHKMTQIHSQMQSQLWKLHVRYVQCRCFNYCTRHLLSSYKKRIAMPEPLMP
jgi:hypothetical protein